jgi:hypothetical protein
VRGSGASRSGCSIGSITISRTISPMFMWSPSPVVAEAASRLTWAPWE